MEQLANPDRQLAERSNGGITTTLYWKPGTVPAETYVRVVDDDKGEVFTIPVEAPALPHEVYNHPYAYLGNQAVEQSGVILGEE